MMRKLENQVAVITGAGSGIGQATALAFAREGASVVVADYNLQAAQETEEIAGAILYLASPEAGFATGSALIIDGGFTAFKLPA